jgi:hypothetical protein
MPERGFAESQISYLARVVSPSDRKVASPESTARAESSEAQIFRRLTQLARRWMASSPQESASRKPARQVVVPSGAE